jgi:hypothetical protein
LATSPLRLSPSNFIFQQNTCGYSPYVTFSLTRGWVCHLQLLLVLASSVILRSDSRGNHDRTLISQIRDSPNLEGQVPVFISPRNREAQLYHQALGPLFVASYDSQGYGEGIRTRHHTGFWPAWVGPTENLSFPYPRKCPLITFTTYLWTHLLITQRRAAFQESISTETCLPTSSLVIGLHVTI